jgi:glutamine cyclotransferase
MLIRPPTFQASKLLFIWLFTVTLACHANANTPPIEFSYTLLDTQAHNPNSFTQGWIKDGDTFFESSGRYSQSFIQRYPASNTRLENGSNNAHHIKTTTQTLDKKYFAEGLTLWGDTLYLLTWQAQTLLLLDKATLRIRHTLPYKGEGWGLTHNGDTLIMSNGTSTLFFRDPDTFAIERTITVKKRLRLNELEYINGIIWANSWYEDRIYAINSHNGCLLGTMDLSLLRARAVTPNDRNVLNGIAYDQDKKALWVTGKYWPSRYLISLPIHAVPSDPQCE